MRHADGQRIGRVGGRSFFQSEHGADHEGDLLFLCAAASDHRLFDQPRGVFVHLEVVSGGDKERGTAGRSEDDCRAHVLHVDDALDGEAGRLVLRGDARQRFVDLAQALVRGELRRILHHAVDDGAQFACGRFEDGVTRSPQGRIDG